MKNVIFIILIVMASGCSTFCRTDRAKVHHVVLCWLKDPGNEDQRRQMTEVSRSFSKIPNVLDVRAGKAIESDRDIVDDSFDVAITVSFANEKDMKAYLAHPIHQKASKETLMPIVKKIVVYDFSE